MTENDSSEPSHDFSSSSEFDSWRLMMGSMIEFISSSTRLLNSINERAKSAGGDISEADEAEGGAAASGGGSRRCSASCSAAGSTEAIIGEGVCADECIVCRDKKGNECSICGGAQEDDAEPPPENEKTSLCVCKQIKMIRDEAKKAGVDVGKGSSQAAAGAGEGKKCQGAESQETNNCACTGDTPTEKVSGACGCSSKSHAGPDPNSNLCSCSVGPREQANLANSLVERLTRAQEEIQQLQVEMSRLQTLEITRQSKQAALYKEIMKDGPLMTSTPKRNSATSRMQTPTVSFAGSGGSRIGVPLANSTMYANTPPAAPPGVPGCCGCPSDSGRMPGMVMPGSLNDYNTPQRPVSCGPPQAPQNRGMYTPIASGGSRGPQTSWSPGPFVPDANSSFNTSSAWSPGSFNPDAASSPVSRTSGSPRCSGRCTQTNRGTGTPSQQVEELCVNYTCDDQCVATTETRTSRTPQGACSATTSTSRSGNMSVFTDPRPSRSGCNDNTCSSSGN